MVIHRIKRQHLDNQDQRQITQFFPTTSTDTFAARDTHYRHREQRPELPETVQANLLNVGMRIRKSVPDGYKTGTYSSFQLWNEFDIGASPIKFDPDMSNGNQSDFQKQQRLNEEATPQQPRELFPFCGILKVGGLDVQPSTSTNSDQQNIMDDMPELSNSQDTIDSMDDDELFPASQETISKKRSYGISTLVDDEGSDIFARDMGVEARQNTTVSKGHIVPTMSYQKITDQETNAEDFDEATFLDYNILEQT